MDGFRRISTNLIALTFLFGVCICSTPGMMHTLFGAKSVLSLRCASHECGCRIVGYCGAECCCSGAMMTLDEEPEIQPSCGVGSSTGEGVIPRAVPDFTLRPFLLLAATALSNRIDDAPRYILTAASTSPGHRDPPQKIPIPA